MRQILLALLLAGCVTPEDRENLIAGNVVDGDAIPDTGDTDTDDTVSLPDVDDDGDSFSEDEGVCDDSNPAINPVATDIVGDLIDQNCDGMDGTDMDGDGYASEISGGDDCDDFIPNTYPDAPDDVWYDGIDTNCDGMSDFDQDGDGADLGPDDCDDLNPEVYAAHDEWAEDGLDNNCDGTIDEFHLEFTTYDWDDIEIEIDGGDPAGHELGMVSYVDDGYPGDNVQEDCITGLCHVIGYAGGELIVTSDYWGVAPNLTFFNAGMINSTTYMLRYNSTGRCITWGYYTAYYTAEGCTELDPTL